MTSFRVVEGALSERYNHFLNYRFHGCTATDTRLMGVVALRVRWDALSGKGQLLQIIHLDYSEYGIDDYTELVVDGSSAVKKREAQQAWARISGSLGGRMKEISYEAMAALIEEAISVSLDMGKAHPQELKDFRRHAQARIRLMRIAADPPGFALQHSWNWPTSLVVPSRLTALEVTNYFLMRFFDRDYAAAAYLCEDPSTVFSSLFSAGLPDTPATLVRNRISGKPVQTDAIQCFRCKAVVLTDQRYQYLELALTLSARDERPHRRVTSASLLAMQEISAYEAALQLREEEYISHYRLLVPAEAFRLEELPAAAQSPLSSVENGLLYPIYHRNNAHVNSWDYHIHHDIYGVYLLTLENELLIMSRKLIQVTRLEEDLLQSQLSQEVELVGRYHFPVQVLQSFADMPGALFSDVVAASASDDPDES